jgi:hypothetical protein
MINPSGKPSWRPATDITHPYTVAAVEAYMPKDRADAILFIGGLGLSEVNDYAGRPDIQADIVATLTAERFPDYFKDNVVLTLVSTQGVA